jgi:endonuclease/exonuclease/phosphatase family metal-dependent hydrolase
MTMNTTMNNVKQNWVSGSGERHARIDTNGSVPGRVLLAVAIALCHWTPMNSGARAQTYVTSTGSVAPEADDVNHPFRLIESAIAAPLRISSDISISPGVYKEAFFADQPCVLEPSVGGVVTIGDLSAIATTTLKIATLNTHLFGDELGGAFGGGIWVDDQRAIDIGNICGSSDWDFVAFQEIWDQHLFLGGGAQQGIRPVSGFPYGFHGLGINCANIICVVNSGLAFMSRYEIFDFDQAYYDDEDDCGSTPCTDPDCYASKGWIQGRIEKDGFSIYILNSHTQADNGGDDIEARRQQIECLLARAKALWEEDSQRTVVVVGDLNVVGDSSEYTNNLAAEVSNQFPNGRDEARHTPGYTLDTHITSSESSAVTTCFDVDTSDARLDYVIVIPPQDDSITVIPDSVTVVPFVGDILSGICFSCDCDFIESDEKSDHWGVVAEIKFFRN